MIKGLPRPFLWTEIKTMDEFLRGDSINVAFNDVVESVKDIYLPKEAEPLKIFNELYYQLTRIYYEGVVSVDYLRYQADINANLWWRNCAELVMIMIYYYIKIKEGHNYIESNLFFEHIRKRLDVAVFYNELHGVDFARSCMPTAKINPKKPHPVSPKEFEGTYLDWSSITAGYGLENVKEVINLWKEEEDKRIVAEMINNSMHLMLKSFPEDAGKFQKVLDYLENITRVDNHNVQDAMICSEPTIEKMRLQEKIGMLENDKMTMQKKIDEFKAENESLKALLNPEKNFGKNRKFTLIEIVEYCKKMLSDDIAHVVVAMVNELLRMKGRNEDYDLLDSVWGELNKKKYGPNIQGDFVLTKNVENEVNGVASGATGINVNKKGE